MEKKTEANSKLTSTKKSGAQTDTGITNFRNTLFSAAFSMSWQLAVAVLLPVIGGYELDNHYKTTPLWTIIGFAIAIVGVVTIVRRTLQTYTPKVKQ